MSYWEDLARDMEGEIDYLERKIELLERALRSYGGEHAIADIEIALGDHATAEIEEDDGDKIGCPICGGLMVLPDPDCYERSEEDGKVWHISDFFECGKCGSVFEHKIELIPESTKDNDIVLLYKHGEDLLGHVENGGEGPITDMYPVKYVYDGEED